VTDSRSDRFEDEDRLAARIDEGAVGVLPTDTAFGLVAPIDRASAVKRVFRIKGRSLEKTVPVLVTAGQAESLAEFTPIERSAAGRFWPGPLTLVLRARRPESRSPGLVREGTVALREPDHPALLRLLDRTGPLVGTSANPAGGATPRRARQLDEKLLERVDFLRRSPAGRGESSSVVRWSPRRDSWTMLREGPIRVESLPRAADREEEPR